MSSALRLFHSNILDERIDQSGAFEMYPEEYILPPQYVALKIYFNSASPPRALYASRAVNKVEKTRNNVKVNKHLLQSDALSLSPIVQS